MPAQAAHVIFIHGLANKPKPSDLERIWLEALGEKVEGDEGFDLGATGVTSSFVYWADLFFETPLPAGDYEASVGTPGELAASVDRNLTLDEDVWTQTMRARFPDEDEQAYAEPPLDEKAVGYERIPIPWFVKQRVMQHFVKEAHDYLFNVEGIRDVIRGRVLSEMDKLPERTRRVLVGHSQGSFIVYDVLTGADACKEVDGLLTLGSPLGVDEIQDKLVWTRDNGFPSKLRGDWFNVYDPYDLVARLDPRLANDFRKGGKEALIDIEEENWGTWRHSATKYLKGRKLRNALRRLCGREGA